MSHPLLPRRRALTLMAGAALAPALPPPIASAQGFAGLGTEAEGFALPERGYAFDFPADHGAHPDFRIEWWYVTANLTDRRGRRYGVQWTLFRSSLQPGGQQAWLGHAALTSATSHQAEERRGRGGTGQAGVDAQPFAAWIDDWRMAGPDFDRLTLRAAGPEFAYALMLSAEGPIVAHGDAGYSVKSPLGQASHYFSQPFYRVTGHLRSGDGPVAVTGSAWADREWSSQPLSADQTGWDWFSLHLDDGRRLMAFRLRSIDGGHFAQGTLIGPDGTAQPMGNDEIFFTPLATPDVAGRAVPTTWRLEVPRAGMNLRVMALNSQAWNALSFPYWEGPVIVTGSHGGEGYLEMTGYA